MQHTMTRWQVMRSEEGDRTVSNVQGWSRAAVEQCIILSVARLSDARWCSSHRPPWLAAIMRRFVCILWCQQKGRFGYRTRRVATWLCLRPFNSSAAVCYGMIWRKHWIHVLNHCISTKRELYATLLLPNFQVRLHIKLNQMQGKACR